MKKAVCLILCGMLLLIPFMSVSAESLSDRIDQIFPNRDSLITMWPEDLSDLMGIGEEEYTDFVYLASENSATGREIIIIMATDETTAESIEDKLIRYRETRLKETRNYLPEAYKLIEASVVTREGLTVILDIGENAENEIRQLLEKE